MYHVSNYHITAAYFNTGCPKQNILHDLSCLRFHAACFNSHFPTLSISLHMEYYFQKDSMKSSCSFLGTLTSAYTAS